MKLNPKNLIKTLRLFPGRAAGVKRKLSTCLMGLVLMLLPMAIRASVTPYPPYPGAAASDSYRVTVNGQPVFVHKFFTFDQFQWMDYASFGMTEKVHVEVTCLVSERKLRGNVVNHSRNVSFQDLLLLRSAYWTVTVSGSQNFSTHHLKIVNRKQQYHDDAYDFTSGTSHILIEDGFAMTMDDTWAFYGGGSGSGIEDFVVKGFVNYSYTCSLAMGYGGAPPVKHLRLEDAHFVANHNKFAIWIQLTPAYFTGRGYSAGARPSRGAALDDFRFVNCTFENDGGHIYIDGGEAPLTDFVFENCVLDRPYKPDKITGKNVSPILFKNVTMNGTVVRNAEDLARAGLDISVPAKFEP